MEASTNDAVAASRNLLGCNTAQVKSRRSPHEPEHNFMRSSNLLLMAASIDHSFLLFQKFVDVIFSAS